ncbi:hypothetical protein COX84_01680 [Candidatus Micrarchaeota archaeon CG_4_10_14_0_2_um_filter_49_7]|nr:MAG: hypothetical protein COX84_01680 [Candidatus Micrarchaeota archaeon CG_4_10_14_0_2_um_filter_49_7]HII53285.1 AsnC family transcriptional regulator [Candidatus Micrarchaeota archaeon]
MVKNIYINEKQLNLDKKDRQILYELDLDARQPASRVAKKVGLSPEGVNYRIKKLAGSGVIFKFMTIMDTAKLGYTTYKVFFRFQNTTIEIEEEIIRYLTEHKYIQYVSTSEGMFDLNINFMARSAEELDTILSELNARYGQYFAECDLNIMVKTHFFCRDYLVAENRASGLRKPVYSGSNPDTVELDGEDEKILAILAKNARVSLANIAGRIGMSPDAVGARIKKLEVAGIIQNYILFLNPEQMGYSFYTILLRFRNLDAENEGKFFQFCRQNPNIWFYTKLLGPWNAAVNLDIAEHNTLKEIVMIIKREFSDILSGYSIMLSVKRDKFDQYPMGAQGLPFASKKRAFSLGLLFPRKRTPGKKKGRENV